MARVNKESQHFVQRLSASEMSEPYLPLVPNRKVSPPFISRPAEDGRLSSPGYQIAKYPYIHGYFVVSFPYFNGTSSIYVCIRKLTQ